VVREDAIGELGSPGGMKGMGGAVARGPLTRWPALGVRRLMVIDVMRGTAMLLVILAHTAWLADSRRVPALPFLTLIRVTNLASMAFVFVSGTMVSYFLETREHRLVVRRFARRALFLALVVHPVIWCACWFWNPGLPSVMVRSWYITDTIAACLVLGPQAMRVLSIPTRAIVAALLPAVSVLLRAYWAPASAAGGVVKELLVGRTSFATYYPLLPWFAVFLAGSVLGARIADAGTDRAGLRSVSRVMAGGGLALMVAGAVSIALYKATRGFIAPALLQALHPDRTTVMFPAYRGALLVIFALIMRRASGKTGFGRVAWATSVIGRSSLFAFVTQFIVVWSLPALFGLKGALTMTTIWPAFALFVAAVGGMSYAYGRLSNRVRPGEYARFDEERLPSRLGVSAAG